MFATSTLCQDEGHGAAARPQRAMDCRDSFAARPTPHSSPPGRHGACLPPPRPSPPGRHGRGIRTRATQEDANDAPKGNRGIYMEGRDSLAPRKTPHLSLPGRDGALPPPRPSAPGRHAQGIRTRATQDAEDSFSGDPRFYMKGRENFTACSLPRRPSFGMRKRATHPHGIATIGIAKATRLFVVGVGLHLLAVACLHVMMVTEWSELDQLILRMETVKQSMTNVHTLTKL